MPLAVPDFRKEASRKRYENDMASPFPSHAAQGWPRLPPSILGTPVPSKKRLAMAKRIWKNIGFYE
jgi:hypothetical protein